MRPVVRVVGLGPGDLDLVTQRTTQLLVESAVVRLRTRIHPAATQYEHLESYDDWYERADSFESLYESIAADLVELARASPTGEVLYVVPGSPVVAERTIELLRASDMVTLICEPAVSVIDLACASLGRDPMTSGLRVSDALDSTEPLRGPGPLLVLQTYSTEVLALVADRLPGDTSVTVLHHLGLPDQQIVELAAGELVSFEAVDHLTSLWIEGLRTTGETFDDLVSFMRRLRRSCPWDQEQTHASLTRHLLEESYEVLDAMEELVRLEGEGVESEEAVAHVEEELGDLLFQIVFHAELGAEEERFTLATIADRVRDKLIGRHPHVFADETVSGAAEVESKWEDWKRDEKGRDSVTDGIVWQMPSLLLYTKLVRKAASVDLGTADVEELRSRAVSVLGAISMTKDATASESEAWGEALSALVEMAQRAGVDLEGVLRERAVSLRDTIRDVERRSI